MVEKSKKLKLSSNAEIMNIDYCIFGIDYTACTKFRQNMKFQKVISTLVFTKYKVSAYVDKFT